MVAAWSRGETDYGASVAEEEKIVRATKAPPVKASIPPRIVLLHSDEVPLPTLAI